MKLKKYTKEFKDSTIQLVIKGTSNNQLSRTLF